MFIKNIISDLVPLPIQYVIVTEISTPNQLRVNTIFKNNKRTNK